MKIITITGFKGGVAKSITSYNLAHFLAKHGTTVLMDSDPNRCCESMAKRAGNLIQFRVCNEATVHKHTRTADWLLIDTPARPNSNQMAEICDGSDLVILPIVPDPFGVEVGIQTMHALAPDTLYRGLLSICPPYPSKEPTKVKEALTEIGMPLFNSHIPRTASFTHAALKGVPLVLLPGASPSGTNAIKNLAREVLELMA